VGTTGGPLQQQGQLSSTSGLEITASIAAVTLGDECGGAGQAQSDFAGRCADDNPCGSTCQASNLQLVFKTGGTGQAGRIEVTSVTLHDASGTEVGALTATNPQSWNGRSYVSWDQTVSPNTELKTSYTLSSPQWSKINGGTASYSAKYLVRISLRLDGATLTLESTALSREPSVAT
jgi:hypothetical protein